MLNYTIIPVTPYQQNCTLLVCEQSQQAVLVDPGGEIEVLLHQVDLAGVRLVSILLTHGHLDHISATAELSERFALPIIGPHIDDEFWIKALPEQCQAAGFPAVKAFTPNRWLADGERVAFGEEELTVIHCPGHTPGHVVFFSQSSGLALVGDVLFKGSIGRTDFPRSDHQALLDSIQQKLWPLGKNIAFIPGHGPMSTFGYEMKHNPFVGQDNYM